jgi:hypothetical protein
MHIAALMGGAHGSVWFGDLMRNARWAEWRKCAKSNGDPGAIRGREPASRAMRL